MRKRCKNITRCSLALLAALLFLFGTALVAYAADAADLDMERTGSVTLTLADSSVNTVSGGELSIYQVASLYLDDGDMAYAYTEAFLGCTAALDVTDTSLAKTLAQFAADNDVSGTAASVRKDGTVAFDGLELGLYLLVQTADSDSYVGITPFVVTVPIDSDGHWEYAVDATPKVVTVSVAGEGEFDESEDIDESEDTDESEETDESEDTGGSDGSGSDESGSDGSAETGTTTSESASETITTTDTILPQTGQLYWPVPLLAAGGLLLFILGRVLKNKDRKETAL